MGKHHRLFNESIERVPEEQTDRQNLTVILHEALSLVISEESLPLTQGVNEGTHRSIEPLNTGTKVTLSYVYTA